MFHAAREKRKADSMDQDSEVAELPVVLPIKNVDPSGDAFLDVGQGSSAIRIRVSGTILGFASSVFRHMLDSRFIEGTTRVILLKEDDPHILLDLCNILHHKAEAVTDISAEKLRALAVVADCRDCVNALSFWMHFQLNHTFQPRPLGPPDVSKYDLNHMDVLTISYVFGFTDHLWNASRAYLCYGKPASKDIPKSLQTLLAVMPEPLMSENQNGTIVAHALKFIADMIEQQRAEKIKQAFTALKSRIREGLETNKTTVGPDDGASCKAAVSPPTVSS